MDSSHGDGGSECHDTGLSGLGNNDIRAGKMTSYTKNGPVTNIYVNFNFDCTDDRE